MQPQKSWWYTRHEEYCFKKDYQLERRNSRLSRIDSSKEQPRVSKSSVRILQRPKRKVGQADEICHSAESKNPSGAISTEVSMVAESESGSCSDEAVDNMDTDVSDSESTSSNDQHRISHARIEKKRSNHPKLYPTLQGEKWTYRSSKVSIPHSTLVLDYVQYSAIG